MVDAPPPPVRAPESPPASTPEPWALDLSATPLRVKALSVDVRGSLRIAGEFRGTLSVASLTPTEASGGQDVAVLRLSAEGVPERLRTLGGGEDEDLHSLHGNVVALRTFGALELGETKLDLPAPIDRFIPPSNGVVIELGEAPTVRRHVENAHRVEAWPLDDGDTLVAAAFDNGEDPLRTTLTRVGSGGERWSTTLPNLEISAAAHGTAQLWVATRGQRMLATHAVDPASGTLEGPVLTVRPGFDDLGRIVALNAEGAAWGHTSAPLVGDLSHSARPFLATRDAFEPQLDATAYVLAVDPDRGDILVSVLHDTPINEEGPAVSGTGVYVLGSAGPRRIAETSPRMGAFTPSHVVTARDCETGSCIEATPR